MYSLTNLKIFQSLVSAIHRFNPIRLIDKRCAIHYRQSVARFRTVVGFQYDHPKIIGRRTSSISSTSSSITPVFTTALTYGDKVAIKDEFGEYTYNQIYNGAAKISIEISKICGKRTFLSIEHFQSFFLQHLDLGSASQCKIAFLCPNSALYTLIQWACWMSGHIGMYILMWGCVI